MPCQQKISLLHSPPIITISFKSKPSISSDLFLLTKHFPLDRVKYRKQNGFNVNGYADDSQPEEAAAAQLLRLLQPITGKALKVRVREQQQQLKIRQEAPNLGLFEGEGHHWTHRRRLDCFHGGSWGGGGGGEPVAEELLAEHSGGRGCGGSDCWSCYWRFKLWPCQEKLSTMYAMLCFNVNVT